MDFILKLDENLFFWFNSWTGIFDVFDGMIIFLAWYLLFIMIAAMFVLVLYPYLRRFRLSRHYNGELFIYAFFSAAVSRFGVTEIIRYLYSRSRPFETLDGVNQLIEHPLGGSFPSGHTAFAFALATAVYFYYPKLGIGFFVVSFMMGFGRVASGVHFPGDILGGAIIGITTAYLLKFLLRRKIA